MYYQYDQTRLLHKLTYISQKSKQGDAAHCFKDAFQQLI
jgi:hypothetical protein